MQLKELQFEINPDSIQLYEEVNKKLFGTDLILMLLSINSVIGKTVMQKQVFITWIEEFYDITNDLGYFPYRYGAYSRIISDSLKFLEAKNLIKVIKRKGEGSIFSITDEGEQLIKTRQNELQISLEKLKARKEKWDEWDREGIMIYVYRKYPQYTSESKVGRLKW